MSELEAAKAACIAQICAIFEDLPYFDALIRPKVNQIINDVTGHHDIDRKTAKVLIERYFDEIAFENLGEDGEALLNQIKIVACSCYVLLLTYNPEVACHYWADTDYLVNCYPQFRQQDAEELNLLLRFRNIVRTALHIVPGHKNKKFLLDIGGRLEGRAKYSEYITGSGQKETVKRRLIIFYTEANLQCKERDDLQKAIFRKPSLGKEKSSGGKRKRIELNLTPHQLEVLAQFPSDPVADIIAREQHSHPELFGNVLEGCEERVVNVIMVMKKAFSEMPHFDELVFLPLRRLIEQQYNLSDDGKCSNGTLENVNEEAVLRACHSLDLFTTKEQKRVLDKMRHVMTACKILLLSETVDAQGYLSTTLDGLLHYYPEFSAIEDLNELYYLLRFRNMMSLGLLVVPGKPKIYLLRVIERLEGSDISYITGKGQTEATDRRVLIYEREGGDAARKTTTISEPRAARLRPSSGVRYTEMENNDDGNDDQQFFVALPSSYHYASTAELEEDEQRMKRARLEMPKFERLETFTVPNDHAAHTNHDWDRNVFSRESSAGWSQILENALLQHYNGKHESSSSNTNASAVGVEGMTAATAFDTANFTSNATHPQQHHVVGSIEKDYAFNPMILRFQPLFNVRNGQLPEGVAEQDTLMMDSMEVFNMPFTETIFGMFTETMQRQPSSSVTRDEA